MLRNIFRRGELCLQAWRLLQDYFMKYFNLMCRLTVNFNFQADAGFLYEKALVTAAVLGGMLNGMICILSVTSSNKMVINYTIAIAFPLLLRSSFPRQIIFI